MLTGMHYTAYVIEVESVTAFSLAEFRGEVIYLFLSEHLSTSQGHIEAVMMMMKCQIHCWRKAEYRQKTTDLQQVRLMKALDMEMMTVSFCAFSMKTLIIIFFFVRQI